MDRPIYAVGEDIATDVQFKVPYADLEVRAVPGCTFISQFYSSYILFIELVEIREEEYLFFPYKVTDFSVFLFFMLEGRGKFVTKEGQLIAEVGSGTCYLTAIDSGNYMMHLEKGTHILAYISARVEWMLRHEDTWPMLVNLVREIQTSGQRVAVMHKIAINRAIGKHLIDIWRASEEENNDIESLSLRKFKDILHIYHDTIQMADQFNYLRSEEKVYAINRYLDQHFKDADIGNIDRLCEKFHITERTLTRVFYKVNGKTISQYLRDIRIAHAQKLLSETRDTIARISAQCGFSSTNYFSRVFSEICGCSPAVFRKQ